MEIAKRKRASLVICSTAFAHLGRTQATALGYPQQPIAIIPHPFGSRTRDEIKDLAKHCVEEVVRLVGGGVAASGSGAKVE